MIDQLPLPKVGDPIKAEHIAAISRALRKRTPLNSPFVKVRETPDGFYLESSRAAAGFPATNDLALDVSTAGIVKAGTILYEMPKIDSTPLDAATPPHLTIPSSGTRYVIATITGTFDVVDSIFVRPIFSSITSVIISLATDPRDYSDMVSASGVFKFALATFVDGVKTAQNGHGPITGELCDDLSGSATAQLNLTWTYP